MGGRICRLAICERSRCLTLVHFEWGRAGERRSSLKPHNRATPPEQKQCGLARALSKLGFCSRSQAWEVIQKGRVRVNGAVQRDPERRVELGRDRIEVDGEKVRVAKKIYLMLNKPRGLVTSADDEKGRATVYECLKPFDSGGADPASDADPAPRVFPVGRLDKASEGLLLFTNDSEWADRLTSPKSHIEKVYHVQVDCVADPVLFERMKTGVTVDGDFLAVRRVALLRHGEINSWMEIVLEEGKNRHIRRLLLALGVNVLRLMRVAIGALQLGSLAKGQTRELTGAEVQSLANAACTAATSASTRMGKGKSDGASSV